MFGILKAVETAIRFVKVYAKLALIIGPALAAFWYSPWFKQFFLGIAVGAAALFAVEYTNLFAFRSPTECINPAAEAGGPVCKVWKPTDPTDPRAMYGHWENCE